MSDSVANEAVMGKPAIGFMLGKFMPPHNGHVMLGEFASAYCEHLVILVATLPDEPIPGRLRYEWMKKLFPNATVVWRDEVLPQAPSGPDDHEFWSVWQRVSNEALGGLQADVVFASEPYGHKLAECLNARFVPCDIDRQTVPISGTRCRQDIAMSWDKLPSVVRSHYVRRVVMFGPESTGKTTLGRILAELLGTVYVPEYGRTYTESFGADVTDIDLRRIYDGHMAFREAAKLFSGPIMIEDTDPVMTAVWSDMLGVERADHIDAFDQYGDLYLLCDVDIPWVNDGTRYFPDEPQRKAFFARCEEELIKRELRYEILRGSIQQRVETALAAISRL